MKLRNSRILARILFCMLVLIFGTRSVYADIDAMIWKKGVDNPIRGKARWLKASKVYKIQFQAQGGRVSELTIPVDQVAQVRAAEPKELSAAIRKVQSGSYASAIPTLEKIKDEYTMFEWDVPATRWLAEAYMGTKNVDKAYGAVMDLKKDNPPALRAPDFFKVYCEILIQKKLYSQVESALDDQIAQGASRETMAVAQLMRGDIQMEKGNYKEALIDGYLRTMYFFQNVRAIQPEAMYKAVQCFKKLGDTSKQDKVRKMLLDQYGSSEYARKLKSE